MNAGAIGGVAAGIAVPIIVALLARLKPYQTPPEFADTSLEELAKQYRKWEVAALIPMFAFIALGSLFWFGLFLLLQSWIKSQQPASVFALYPDKAIWLLPAFFLGIISAALPMHLLYRFLLGNRYPEYLHYTNRRAGFNGFLIFKWMAIGIVLLSFLAITLGLDCYARFTDDKLIANSFFSWGEREHPYAQIRELRDVARITAPNGNIVDRPHGEIAFNDGTIYSTEYLGLAGDDKARDLAIMQFLNKKTGKPIVKYDLVPQ